MSTHHPIRACWPPQYGDSHAFRMTAAERAQIDADEEREDLAARIFSTLEDCHIDADLGPRDLWRAREADAAELRALLDAATALRALIRSAYNLPNVGG